MTAKGRNSNSEKNSDNSLPKSKILRGQRNFQQLFEKSTLLNSPTLQFRYRIYTNPESKCMIGFIAPKKLYKLATDRNKVKRLMREAYRLNQHILTEVVKKASIELHGAFICKKKSPGFDEINKDLISLLQQAEQKIVNHVNPG